MLTSKDGWRVFALYSLHRMVSPLHIRFTPKISYVAEVKKRDSPPFDQRLVEREGKKLWVIAIPTSQNFKKISLERQFTNDPEKSARLFHTT